jgi:hypothetical protein
MPEMIKIPGAKTIKGVLRSRFLCDYPCAADDYGFEHPSWQYPGGVAYSYTICGDIFNDYRACPYGHIITYLYIAYYTGICADVDIVADTRAPAKSAVGQLTMAYGGGIAQRAIFAYHCKFIYHQCMPVKNSQPFANFQAPGNFYTHKQVYQHAIEQQVREKYEFGDFRSVDLLRQSEHKKYHFTFKVLMIC